MRLAEREKAGRAEAREGPRQSGYVVGEFVEPVQASISSSSSSSSPRSSKSSSSRNCSVSSYRSRSSSSSLPPPLRAIATITRSRARAMPMKGSGSALMSSRRVSGVPASPLPSSLSSKCSVVSHGKWSSQSAHEVHAPTELTV